MTGEEHFHEAENLLRLATVDTDQLYAETKLAITEALAAAQVHATLALVTRTGARMPIWIQNGQLS